MQVDTQSSLGSIRSRHPDGLVPQLLEIQKHGVPQAKWLDWARNPLCLRRVYQKPSRKRKRGADSAQVSSVPKIFHRVPRSGRPYVAVSYTSQPSEHESNAGGGHLIMDPRHSNAAAPTKVRGCVLSRANKYAEHKGVGLIWIDNECINRDNAEEHEMAMQSMDLIYSFSKYPVGLLTKPIRSQKSLDLLEKLLNSDFVEMSDDRDTYVLKPEPELSVEVALEVVDLLDYITLDKWWSRAWIFQEAYRSSVKMDLLIPHSLHLDRIQASKDWCRIPGEIQVNSVDFHAQSTLFCLAFLGKVGAEWQGGRARCKEILKRARKYNILYQHGDLAGQGSTRKAMSPFIFTDIGSREISVASDLLAIAANCCNYPMRLNTKSLDSGSYSLSISILALYLLNGEIIMNNKYDETLLSKNIFDYLQLLALDNFDPPVKSRELVFIKKCRLVDVRLSPDGIVTKGRLWVLHKAIDTGAFTSRPPSESKSPHGLNEFQRSRLRQLSVELGLQGHRTLADDLDGYLHEDAEDQSGPSKEYKDLMAEKVVEAIRNRQTIHLACLEGSNPYRGIFVTDAALGPPSHAFTAWSAAGSGRKSTDSIRAKMLLDRIVSLEVEVDMTNNTLEGLPRLKTKRWINGLCFFDGDPAHDVVFDYPMSLTA